MNAILFNVLTSRIVHKVPGLHGLLTAILWGEIVHRRLLDDDQVGGVFLWKNPQMENKVEIFNFSPHDANATGRKFLNLPMNAEYKKLRDNESD